ncbi:MAG: PqqD family protein [Acidobacteria bacterium]|nr:PqqD family protein [Acidobacteriota bacterium]
MGNEAFHSLMPERALPFETGDDGRVTVIRPKALAPRWAWILRFLGKPNYRVRLDERGSFLWGLCDGCHTVAELGCEMAARFGEEGGDHRERSAAFVRELLKGGFLRPAPARREEPPVRPGPAQDLFPGPEPPASERQSPMKASGFTTLP